MSKLGFSRSIVNCGQFRTDKLTALVGKNENREIEHSESYRVYSAASRMVAQASDLSIGHSASELGKNAPWFVYTRWIPTADEKKVFRFILRASPGI